MYEFTASLSWTRLGIDRPSVAMFEPSTTTCCELEFLGVIRRVIVESSAVINAVFFDFGGVILASPFEAFNRYEAEKGLPQDFIRRVNAADLHANAWARLERSEISGEQFDAAFAAESERFGHRVPGAEVLSLLGGQVRPEMVVALDRVIEAGYTTACLTNNVVGGDARDDVAAVMVRFHHVVESSKVGVRKPEPAFYELACRLAQVTPPECAFLDDLGVNLKPAAAMGMTTIKVTSAEQAIGDLEVVLGIPLR
jgi:putative hydrolase of the HAD superfamily